MTRVDTDWEKMPFGHLERALGNMRRATQELERALKRARQGCCGCGKPCDCAWSSGAREVALRAEKALKIIGAEYDTGESK